MSQWDEWDKSAVQLRRFDPEYPWEGETVYGCVPPTNVARRVAFWILRWPMFSYFMVVAILVNSGMLGKVIPLSLVSRLGPALTVPHKGPLIHWIPTVLAIWPLLRLRFSLLLFSSLKQPSSYVPWVPVTTFAMDGIGWIYSL